DVVALDQVIHDVSDRRLQMAAATKPFESRIRPRAVQVNRKQGHAALAGVTCKLVEILFLALAGLANTDDDRRGPPSGGSRQEVSPQGIAAGPGNQHDFTSRAAMSDVVARALAHTLDGELMILVVVIERKCRGLIIADGAQPVASGRQHVAIVARGIAA